MYVTCSICGTATPVPPPPIPNPRTYFLSLPGLLLVVVAAVFVYCLGCRWCSPVGRASSTSSRLSRLSIQCYARLKRPPCCCKVARAARFRRPLLSPFKRNEKHSKKTKNRSCIVKLYDRRAEEMAGELKWIPSQYFINAT